MNSLMLIQPYRRAETWVFDDADTRDADTGLLAGPLVTSVLAMIDRLVIRIPDADAGFRLLFAGVPFPGAQIQLQREHEEIGGWWFRCHTHEARVGSLRRFSKPFPLRRK